MGLTYDKLESTPFYMISLLQPEGLDALWRIKKVMHPDNLKAMRYALFEEILSNKTMEEILSTPQPYPYYEPINNNRYPEMTDEFMAKVAELNKDIKYFRNFTEVEESTDQLIDKTKNLSLSLTADPTERKGNKENLAVKPQRKAPEQKEKGLLKGLFRK